VRQGIFEVRGRQFSLCQELLEEFLELVGRKSVFVPQLGIGHSGPDITDEFRRVYHTVSHGALPDQRYFIIIAGSTRFCR
jgi:hypothetical protein